VYPRPSSRLPRGRRGNTNDVAEKTDYSPVVEEPTPTEERRERRRLVPALAFSWGFLLFAIAVAAVILLVIYLTGGFGEGSEPREGLTL
jgi:hypothetical protein